MRLMMGMLPLGLNGKLNQARQAPVCAPTDRRAQARARAKVRDAKLDRGPVTTSCLPGRAPLISRFWKGIRS